MDVAIQYDGLGEEITSTLTAHLAERWAPFVRVAILPDEISDENAELEALLVIGKNPKAKRLSSVISETIQFPQHDGDTVSIEELLFEIDTKLGRLAHSDLAKSRPPGSMVPDRGRSEFSRRELIFSIRKGFQKHSDAPVVFQRSCEARFGCRACIEICPVSAITLGDRSSVIVSEADCKRCGLCAAACRVSAIQMPRFSEAALGGLLAGMPKSQSETRRTTLVITCNQDIVEKSPWMDVEQVQDVGVIGVRQLVKVLTSPSVDSLVIYCPDGLCLGKNAARRAVESIFPLSSQSGIGKAVAFFEGMSGLEEIKKICIEGSATLSSGPPISVKLTGRPWEDYVASIKALEKLADSHLTDAGMIPLSGFQLTDVSISRTCTLCSACVSVCPHHSFSSSQGELVFDPRGCTSCGLCAKICPEHSINLSSIERMDSLKSRIAFNDVIVECAECKKPLGSRGFLNRVQTLVGEEDRTMRYCSNCKQKHALDSLMNMGLNRR